MNDINRMNQVLQFSKQSSRDIFLRNFEIGLAIMASYRKAVDFSEKEIKIIFDIPSLLTSIANEGVPIKHGQAIGTFIGILRSHPHNILSYKVTKRILEVIQSMFLHEWFKFYIAGIIKEWCDAIQNIKPPLQAYEQTEYGKYKTYLSRLE